jgi:cystathionine gamma-lyase
MKHDSLEGLGFGTIAIHAGQKPDPVYGAICTPIFQTSTFVQKSPGVVVEDYDYSRAANPTRTALEQNLAGLEGGKYGICFSSGLASIAAVIHLLKSGDHAILNDDVYGGTYRLFDKVFQQMGIRYSMVDMNNPAALQAAFTPTTKLVWIETPTNPKLKIVDIKAVAEIAHKNKALLAVDNTFATPYLQRPLELGADIVSHSSTKYLGGHSDLIGGALVCNDPELGKQLHFIQKAVGAVPSPLECFMILRSTKTLHVRMKTHCENAKRVAEFLNSHPMIEKVMFPGLPSDPGHAVAKRQMKDFGGMVTCIIKGGIENSRKMLERVKVFSLAESLGGVESLIDHPAIMTHASIPKEMREAQGISDGLVRLSVGIEECDDLIADLKQALQ